jgi:hypothetical protein
MRLSGMTWRWSGSSWARGYAAKSGTDQEEKSDEYYTSDGIGYQPARYCIYRTETDPCDQLVMALGTGTCLDSAIPDCARSDCGAHLCEEVISNE